MKTGIELIAEERQEQIEKHGWSLEHDQNYYRKELIQAAEYCLASLSYNPKAFKKNFNSFWPEGWSTKFMFKIVNKDDIQKLTVAGAFYMAENDRRKRRSRGCDAMIELIAEEIDNLQSFKSGK